jgi:DNA repair ATPase RecN
MGIADILRGSSNPMDGQGTQVIKERWAGIRLRRKQRLVQETVRDLFRMMAELTVEHITPDNLERMTQIKMDPQVYELLRNDLMREFAIDVETDSTIMKDEGMEREQRAGLLTAVTGYIEKFAPAVASNLIPADLATEMLKIASEPYKKYSRGLDDVLEQLPDNMKQLGQAQQQIQQLTGQAEQLNGQLQQLTGERDQMQYALDQFSQAEERRKTQESDAKTRKGDATAAKTGAGVQDETMQPGLTQAEIELKGADVALKGAQTIDTLRPDDAGSS